MSSDIISLFFFFFWFYVFIFFPKKLRFEFNSDEIRMACPNRFRTKNLERYLDNSFLSSVNFVWGMLKFKRTSRY